MYEIKGVNEKNMHEVEAFLNEVPSINDIDMKIIMNASLLYENEKIAGIISYEPFAKYALIRYFIFKRDISEFVVRELFSDLVAKIKNLGILYLFSLVNEEAIKNLFLSLDFYEISEEKIFIEEKSFTDFKVKDAKLMIKNL